VAIHRAHRNLAGRRSRVRTGRRWLGPRHTGNRLDDNWSVSTSGPRLQALVVEDDAAIREILALHLGLAGFEIEGIGDGRQALDRVRQQRFDLLLLDVMLPGLDGVSLCRAARKEGPNADTPILMLTARDSESDTVVGLESGADDYLTKPFGIRELQARISALMRRHQRAAGAAHGSATRLTRGTGAGQISIDVERREVMVRGQPVELTKQEFDVLYQLASRPGVVFPRAALLQKVWSDDTYVTERTVDTIVSRVRKKIEQDPHDPELILTAWGVGYKFADVG
jgi:DNA-binding response OmpR family regulator